MEIYENKSSALIALNIYPITEVGEIYKFRYYTESGKDIDTLIAIGTKKGIGPSCYSIISDQETLVVNNYTQDYSDVTYYTHSESSLYYNSTLGTYSVISRNSSGDLESRQITDNKYFVNLSDNKVYYLDLQNGVIDISGSLLNNKEIPELKTRLDNLESGKLSIDSGSLILPEDIVSDSSTEISEIKLGEKIFKLSPENDTELNSESTCAIQNKVLSGIIGDPENLKSGNNLVEAINSALNISNPISGITQTLQSTEDGGLNVITISLKDGSEYSFTVQNGNEGKIYNIESYNLSDYSYTDIVMAKKIPSDKPFITYLEINGVKYQSSEHRDFDTGRIDCFDYSGETYDKVYSILLKNSDSNYYLSGFLIYENNVPELVNPNYNFVLPVESKYKSETLNSRTISEYDSFAKSLFGISEEERNRVIDLSGEMELDLSGTLNLYYSGLKSSGYRETEDFRIDVFYEEDFKVYTIISKSTQYKGNYIGYYTNGSLYNNSGIGVSELSGRVLIYYEDLIEDLFDMGISTDDSDGLMSKEDHTILTYLNYKIENSDDKLLSTTDRSKLDSIIILGQGKDHNIDLITTLTPTQEYGDDSRKYDLSGIDFETYFGNLETIIKGIENKACFFIVNDTITRSVNIDFSDSEREVEDEKLLYIYFKDYYYEYFINIYCEKSGSSYVYSDTGSNELIRLQGSIEEDEEFLVEIDGGYNEENPDESGEVFTDKAYGEIKSAYESGKTIIFKLSNYKDESNLIWEFKSAANFIKGTEDVESRFCASTVAIIDSEFVWVTVTIQESKVFITEKTV